MPVTQSVATTTSAQAYGFVSTENVHVAHQQPIFVRSHPPPSLGYRMSCPPITVYGRGSHYPMTMPNHLPMQSHGHVNEPQVEEGRRLSLGPLTVDYSSTSLYDLLWTRSTIERFDGSSRFPAEMWIEVFETITTGLGDIDRITLLTTYLEKDALRWFAQFVLPRRHVYDWPTVRSMFYEKFAKTTVKPATTAAARVLQPRESIQSYFDEKTRLLELARIPEDAQIEFLTEGLPDAYRTVVAAREPTNLSQWLSCVSRYKTPRASEPSRLVNVTDVTAKNTRRRKSNRQTNDTVTRTQYDDVPPSPCPRCSAYGKTEYHWARVCSYPKLDPKSRQTERASNERNFKSKPISKQNTKLSTASSESGNLEDGPQTM